MGRHILIVTVLLAMGCSDRNDPKASADGAPDPVADATAATSDAPILILDAPTVDAALGDAAPADASPDAAGLVADAAAPDAASTDASTPDAAPDAASITPDAHSPDAALASDAGPTVVFPGATWTIKTPAEVGLNGAVLDQFAANIGGVGCIIRDGYLVKSWGSASSKADWASAFKPVTSTMLLFAVKEGKLASVDAKLSDWGWAMSTADKVMTFRHLANMMSGYARVEAPGKAWAYNDYAVTLYSKTLFDRVFNEGSPNAAATKASRLGALQFQDGTLYSSRQGYGISTSPRDFARIGWFWLNRGNWNGVQLLPAAYFDQYRKPQVPGTTPRTATNGYESDYLGVGSIGGTGASGTDQFAYGPGIYGFNWWFNAPVGTSAQLTWPDAPADTFQANGHWNVEVMTIIPSLRMVVAARGNWGSFKPGSASAGMNQNLKLLVSAVVH